MVNNSYYGNSYCSSLQMGLAKDIQAQPDQRHLANFEGAH